MKVYSKTEDRLNTLSHLGGLVALSFLLVPIIYRSVTEGDKLKTLAFTMYYIGVGMMFLSSTMYHGAKNPKIRQVFRLIDHCAIPLSIAGTYTPIVLLGLKGNLAKVIFLLVWILALTSIIIHFVYFGKVKPKAIERLSIGIYLAMGWISLVLIKPIIDQLSFGFFNYILLGGLLYTVGVFFYRYDKIPYNHAIWHGFILVATFAIFAGIYIYLA